ncbi:MAG: hypothetical protein SPL02_00710 [Bacilli bacterium]|nr:hypothetical protein [Bacilli bacterium]MDY6430353.1 hypothetical protein [Bacilli bacterium]
MKRTSLLLLSLVFIASCSGNKNPEFSSEKPAETSSISEISSSEESISSEESKSSESIFSSEEESSESIFSSEESESKISSESEESSEESSISETGSEEPEPAYIEMNNDVVMKDILDPQGMHVCPSLGDINVLVIPVEFTDYPFSKLKDKYSHLEEVFNAEQLDYFYSLRKYYELSSYGKLNFNFEVADIYSAEMATSNIKTSQGVVNLCQRLFNLYSSAHLGEMDKFDSDGDGCADAVWFIYSAPDYSHNTSLSDAFWAFTTYLGNVGTHDRPALNTMAWASIDFQKDPNGGYHDAHTIIHETGHMLGLDDYYSYAGHISPLGGIDMMDNNVIDHNPWSKYALGWINPKLVINDIEDITLDLFQENGDAIFLSLEDYPSLNPFGEFIVFEYYSPTRLNETDSHKSKKYLQAMTNSGIRVYHVDSRLMTYDEAGYPMYATYESGSDQIYYVSHSNTKNSGAYETQYSLITVIDSQGRNFAKSYISASNESMFYDYDYIDFFTERFNNQFVNDYQPNCKGLFPNYIQINELEETCAHLSITI